MNAITVDAYCETHKLLPCTCINAARSKKKNKFNAIRTEADGIWFDSRKEAERYKLLIRMAKDGIISALEIHPKFELHAAINVGKTSKRKAVGFYEADFSYMSKDDVVVEDCKGGTATMTQLAKWKIKHFEIQYGMKVKIV